MPALTTLEESLLREVCQDLLMDNTGNLARWERVSGTPAEWEAVEYLRGRLEEYGLAATLYQFEALLGWPEESLVEILSPKTRPLESITHALVPSTPEGGLEAEVVDLGAGGEADFALRPVAGRIALVDGMASPLKVMRGQQHGVAALVFVAADRLRDYCVSPVWGTATSRTAGLLPAIPVVSILPEGGRAVRDLLVRGPVRLRLRTRTHRAWHTVPLLVGDVEGAVEPDRFVLLSGHHCSWYHGAMDNGSANATMLEVARVLSAHRRELRRSFRVAFWPGHTQGRYAGSAWYADHFWEEIHDRCVLHVNVDSTGARGATHFDSITMPETSGFALEAIRDGAGAEGQATRQSRAGDQSFWGCGVPAMWMHVSQVPAEMAAKVGGAGLLATGSGGAAERLGGAAPWWHTPDDTIDKIAPEVLATDTRVYLLACLRAATSALLPFRYAAAAESLRGYVERYQAAAGTLLDLGPVLERALQLESAAGDLDGLLDRAQGRPVAEASLRAINEGLRALDRVLVRLNFSAVDPFDQDLAVPIPPVPLLEPATRLATMDPKADETRFLLAELTRNRNRVAFQLREALEAAGRTAQALRAAVGP